MDHELRWTTRPVKSSRYYIGLKGCYIHLRCSGKLLIFKSSVGGGGGGGVLYVGVGAFGERAAVPDADQARRQYPAQQKQGPMS